MKPTPSTLLAGLCFMLFSMSAMAQFYPANAGQCAAGHVGVEIVNETPCDYTLTIYYLENGEEKSSTATVTTGTRYRVCYDPETSSGSQAVANNGNDQGEVFRPESGAAVSPIDNGGCGGTDQLSWSVAADGSEAIAIAP